MGKVGLREVFNHSVPNARVKQSLSGTTSTSMRTELDVLLHLLVYQKLVSIFSASTGADLRYRSHEQTTGSKDRRIVKIWKRPHGEYMRLHVSNSSRMVRLRMERENGRRAVFLAEYKTLHSGFSLQKRELKP